MTHWLKSLMQVKEQAIVDMWVKCIPGKEDSKFWSLRVPSMSEEQGDVATAE